MITKPLRLQLYHIAGARRAGEFARVPPAEASAGGAVIGRRAALIIAPRVDLAVLLAPVQIRQPKQWKSTLGTTRCAASRRNIPLNFFSTLRGVKIKIICIQ
jgi:hypothetical protein